jgi:outer membrane protein TolC
MIAAIEARQARLDALESWTGLGLTPSVRVARSFTGNTSVASTRFSASVGALDAPAWFSAGEASADAQVARWLGEGATLDAQYAAALLYFEVIESEAGVDAAKSGEEAAAGTLAAASARVIAGLDSILIQHQAESALLTAKAKTRAAEACVRVARLRLERALQIDDLGNLATPAALDLPASADEPPELAASKAALDAARWNHGGTLAGLLPVGSLEATAPAEPFEATLTVGATWTFDGLAGPFLRERRSALAVKAAEIAYDAARRDLALGIAAATEEARAAHELAEAARARQTIAAEALEVGQRRVAAGLDSALQLLLLQDDLASARADRVSADLAEATAILVARRTAGLRWE